MQSKNKLTDFDYCIRKAIAVYTIGGYLKKTGIDQEVFAEDIGVHQSDISKWLSLTFQSMEGVTYIASKSSSRYAPTFVQLMSAADKMKTSVAEMIRNAVECDKKQRNHLLSEDFSNTAEMIASSLIKNDRRLYKKFGYPSKSAHDLSRIVKLEKSTYLGFYLHKSDESSHEVNHFIMDTYGALDTGAVPVLIRNVGRASDMYRGNIVSDPAQPYLYIYMRQDTGTVDRGVMVFRYFDGDVQGAYKCGSGVMLSTERNLLVPHLHWVIIIKIKDNIKMIENDTVIDERDTVEIVRQAQRQAKEIDRKDELFLCENGINEIDKLIRPVLEEALPLPNEHYILFEELSERQIAFHDGIYKELIAKKTFSDV